MATNSIYDLKKGFLSSQLRILNGPLDPPRDWQEQIPEGEYGDLPQVVVDQVLYKRRQFIMHLCPLFYNPPRVEAFFPFFRKKKDPPPRELNTAYRSAFLVNIVAKKHQKLVYSAQALRHVAEQIDDLYWKNNNNLGGTTRDDDALRRGVDLKDPQ